MGISSPTSLCRFAPSHACSPVRFINVAPFLPCCSLYPFLRLAPSRFSTSPDLVRIIPARRCSPPKPNRCVRPRPSALFCGTGPLKDCSTGVESSQPTIEQVEKKPENWGRWEPLRLMGGGAAKACARDAVECFICLECCRCLCDCACDISESPSNSTSRRLI